MSQLSLLLALAGLNTLAVMTQASEPASERQLQLLASNCVQCHARAETGAPRMGFAADWREARTRGEEAMLVNVVKGIRGMPPLGYCSACSEDDLRILIRLLAGAPDAAAVAQ